MLERHVAKRKTVMFVFHSAVAAKSVKWDGIVAKNAARAVAVPAKLSDAQLKAKLDNLDAKLKMKH